MPAQEPSISLGNRSKSEVITIRVTPKVKFGLEINARVHNRSVAQTTDRAVQHLLGINFIEEIATEAAAVKSILDKIWSPHQGARFLNLVRHYPELMSHEEECLWDKMVRTGLFDDALEAPVSSASTWKAGIDFRIFERLAEEFMTSQ